MKMFFCRKELVFLHGGLGNQMFQYAFYLGRKKRGVNIDVSKGFFRWMLAHNGFELGNVFGLEVKETIPFSFKVLSRLDSRKITKPFVGLLDRLGMIRMIREDENTEIPSARFSVKSSGETLWFGYWQSERFFASIRKQVLATFAFDEKKASEATIAVLSEIRNKESVSVHIRRGDYLALDYLFGGICTPEYYRKAIEKIEMEVKNPSYFIFSDDIPWCVENLSLPGAVFVDWNNGEESWQDMFLMSECKHNVIANSSFSWWGAWLNQNPNKIVVSPPRFYNAAAGSDIVPLSWNTIKG